MTRHGHQSRRPPLLPLRLSIPTMFNRTDCAEAKPTNSSMAWTSSRVELPPPPPPPPRRLEDIRIEPHFPSVLRHGYARKRLIGGLVSLILVGHAGPHSQRRPGSGEGPAAGS